MFWTPSSDVSIKFEQNSFENNFPFLEMSKQQHSRHENGKKKFSSQRLKVDVRNDVVANWNI